jgi:hypothetical protein
MGEEEGTDKSREKVLQILVFEFVFWRPTHDPDTTVSCLRLKLTPPCHAPGPAWAGKVAIANFHAHPPTHHTYLSNNPSKLAPELPSRYQRSPRI